MAGIGILGGTFDPVHCGHLRLALEVRDLLSLASVRLLPAPNPRLRDAPRADVSLRLQMLEAAVEGEPGLEVDARELEREGPTYTVDSLQSFRREFPDAPIVFIVGMDSLRRLDRWHRWQEFTSLAHLAVADRPGGSLPGTGPVADLLAAHRCDDPATLMAKPAGHIMICSPPLLDISATRIRALVAEGRSIRFLVPDKVIELINRTRCYADEE
ncbi:MAG: nicotinate-nucleotide adenylyltransferase [Gammaproteobacteria bacterium]|nr:nicotinate-nucleotide adenylyltransferase [Gammaproteobacteria bacterium]NIO23698.1 nicotinate-nucleotide adenylyltransferase [Gammaproteobacteria bacterium]NIO64314.1 nicotinate-nucleotide adenylyltransferase [Gammaproteobacteria bacterium]NIP46163.1 nicotinate-nucleotide adenylyltransferase [Gammaproteobacteria bacterium]NIP63196.1 nicotinate-nucleotide adenylyltransferase [Gammaproteobacteria bacterium]